MTPRNLTTAEAAERAGISVRMMRHYVQTERIAHVEKIGNTMMFSVKDVDELAGRIERRNRVREVAA